MDFMYKGKRCVLRGTSQSTLQWMQGKLLSSSLSQMGVEISSMAMCVCPATLRQMIGANAQSEPSIHTIPLSPNTPPINIRPYKHPPNKKDVIELMVKELLEARIIRNSQSSFSSPIVMVKKKDETWRMCVDY
ncbi:hypothetical protein Tco_0230222, partial [Tanacetum coccineum]